MKKDTALCISVSIQHSAAVFFHLNFLSISLTSSVSPSLATGFEILLLCFLKGYIKKEFKIWSFGKHWTPITSSLFRPISEFKPHPAMYVLFMKASPKAL